MITPERLDQCRRILKRLVERDIEGKALLGAAESLLAEVDSQKDALSKAIDRADRADAKRQRARQHCIQVIGQCLGGGDSQLAADAIFNMVGLLYDEADDKQPYPPV